MLSTMRSSGTPCWKLVVNDWINHDKREAAGTINLTAGRHDIKVEYFVQTGSALAQLRWSTPTIAKEFVPSANLYAAGGIAAPPATLAELPAVLREHGTTVVCVCSSDAVYATGLTSLDVVRQAATGFSGATNVMSQPNRRRLGRQETTYWNYKVLGRYVFPYDFGVSGSYKLQSGYNWARNTSVTLPNAGSESILMEPLSSNRTENVHIVDFRIEKGFRLRGAGKVTGMIDLFNALNANPITGFRTVTGARFKELIAVLDPRAARFGIRWDF